ncbi:hypothetical protein GF420_15645 [candidate division GN15 bacterium]|nr:hypothetical protein [candidate division GN15 bacterium]
MNIQKQIERLRDVYHNPKCTKQWFFSWASYEKGKHPDLDAIIKDFEPRVFWNIDDWLKALLPVFQIPEIYEKGSFSDLSDDLFKIRITPNTSALDMEKFSFAREQLFNLDWKPGVYAQIKPDYAKEFSYYEALMAKFDELSEGQISHDLHFTNMNRKDLPKFMR